jgi:ATP-binding cassette subfamily E protein 1
MGIYLGNRIIVFSGSPSISAIANTPLGIGEGVNKFLKEMDITFRLDQVTLRPRINKLDSTKHRDQKKRGEYIF